MKTNWFDSGALACVIASCAIACGGTPGADAQSPSPPTTAAGGALTVSAQTASTMFNLDGARAMVEAAEAEARKANVAVTVVVVDDTGEPIVVSRMDDGAVGDVRAAMSKAKTAALFGKSTAALEEAATGGRRVLIGLEGLSPVAGGLPVVAGGRSVGAVGVSGGTPAQDVAIVEAALRAVKRN